MPQHCRADGVCSHRPNNSNDIILEAPYWPAGTSQPSYLERPRWPQPAAAAAAVVTSSQCGSPWRRPGRGEEERKVRQDLRRQEGRGPERSAPPSSRLSGSCLGEARTAQVLILPGPEEGAWPLPRGSPMAECLPGPPGESGSVTALPPPCPPLPTGPAGTSGGETVTNWGQEARPAANSPVKAPSVGPDANRARAWTWGSSDILSLVMGAHSPHSCLGRGRCTVSQAQPGF